MIPTEVRQISKSNGSMNQQASTSNSDDRLTPSQINGLKIKKNFTNVPPVVHLPQIINNPNERIVYRLVLTGGKSNQAIIIIINK